MPQPLTYLRPVYTEEQRFTELLPRWVRRLGIIIALLGVLWMAVTAALVISGIISRLTGIAFAFTGWSLLTPFLFTGATVLTVVEPDRLRLRLYMLGLRLWRKDLPLAQILSCDIVHPQDNPDTHIPIDPRPRRSRLSGRAAGPPASRPAPDSSGIRMTRRFALVNRSPGQLSVMVTGGPAVLLRTGRFNRLLLGSRTPDALAEAIRSGMTTPVTPPPNTP